MTEQDAGSFADLLRRLRTEASLSQEDLAEAAGLSSRSISDLERGVHPTSRRDTARLLADALHLVGSARAMFEAAATGRLRDPDSLPGSSGALARSVAATTPSLPLDTPDFTGRDGEIARVLETATAAEQVVQIFAIDGMAGVGKTTFAVHVAHLLRDHFPDGQIYLVLNAHTAGHRPVDPADALAALLVTTGVPRDRIPETLPDRAVMWRAHLAGKRMLLLLDDAAGHDQVRPLLPGAAGSLVLITSRRHLSALDGSTSICLGVLPPEAAAALLIRIADRPDLDFQDAAVTNLTELCGNLPLAIAMLARHLHHHPARSAAGLARYLEAARNRLEVMLAENLSVAATFDMSYQELTDDQQRLFRRLGLHPGTDIDPLAAAALDEITPSQARLGLDELFDQHLVEEPVSMRYRLHSLLREHASTLAATDGQAEREAAIARLMDYYVHATAEVGSHFSRGIGADGQARAEVPHPTSLAEAERWMEAERANLHAIVDLAAQMDWPEPAISIVTAMSDFLRTHGHWTNMSVLHLTALEAARRAGHKGGEIEVLTNLGTAQRLTGNCAAAAATISHALELCAERGDQAATAKALLALGAVQRRTADFKIATETLARALRIFQDVGDQAGEADAANELACAQRLTGDFAAAMAGHRRALDLYRQLGDEFGQAAASRYLGRVYATSGDIEAARSCYEQALELCRRLGDRLSEADTLNYLGFAHFLARDFSATAQAMTAALDLYVGLGHRFGQVKALNSLGDLYAGRDPARARELYDQALAMARDIAAILEQGRALEGLGLLALNAGDTGTAADHLHGAVEVYDKIGSRHADRARRALSACAR